MTKQKSAKPDQGNRTNRTVSKPLSISLEKTRFCRKSVHLLAPVSKFKSSLGKVTTRFIIMKEGFILHSIFSK